MSEPVPSADSFEKPIQKKQGYIPLLSVIIVIEVVLIGIKIIPNIIRKFSSDSKPAVVKTDQNVLSGDQFPAAGNQRPNPAQNGNPKREAPAGGNTPRRNPDQKTPARDNAGGGNPAQKEVPSRPGPARGTESRPGATETTEVISPGNKDNAASEQPLTRRNPGESSRRGGMRGGPGFKMTGEMLERMLGRFSAEDLVKKGEGFAARIPMDDEIKKRFQDAVSDAGDNLLGKKEGELDRDYRSRLQSFIDSGEYPEWFTMKAGEMLNGLQVSPEPASTVSAGEPPGVSLGTDLSADSIRPMKRFSGMDEIKTFSLSESSEEDVDRFSYDELLTVFLKVLDGSAPLRDKPSLYASYSGIDVNSDDLTDDSRKLIGEINSGIRYCRELFFAGENPTVGLARPDDSELIQLAADSDRLRTALGIFYLLRTDLSGSQNTALYHFRKSGLNRKSPLIRLIGIRQDLEVSVIIRELGKLRKSAEEAEQSE